MAANCEQDPWSMHMYFNMMYEKNCSAKGKAQFLFIVLQFYMFDNELMCGQLNF